MFKATCQRTRRLFVFGIFNRNYKILAWAMGKLRLIQFENENTSSFSAKYMEFSE